jgi:hypothetical protein
MLLSDAKRIGRVALPWRGDAVRGGSGIAFWKAGNF